MTEEVEQQILERYELTNKLGRGAYGFVWKVLDKKYNQIVALKKLFGAFFCPSDALVTYREVMFLLELKGHENIIRIINIIKAKNKKDLYLIYDYMEADLHHVIRANILDEIHKQYIIYQILKAVKYIHSAGLVHRFLKPSSILINSDCQIKIKRFRFAKTSTSLENASCDQYEYFGERWYHAPELFLNPKQYSKATDMWSVGCILGELILGKIIFQNTSPTSTLEKIFELIGKPKSNDVEAIDSPDAARILSSINIAKKRSFHSYFPNASEPAIDLLKRLLVFNPNHRLTAEEALKHKYVEQFHSPDEEPAFDHIIKIPMDNNPEEYSVKDYEETIYREVAKIKNKNRKKRLTEISDVNVGSNASKQQDFSKLNSKASPSKY